MKCRIRITDIKNDERKIHFCKVQKIPTLKHVPHLIVSTPTATEPDFCHCALTVLLLTLDMLKLAHPQKFVFSQYTGLIVLQITTRYYLTSH